MTRSDGTIVPVRITNPKTAIRIVAAQILSSTLENVTWEDYPEIGKHDWIAVERELARQAPPPQFYAEAMTALEERATDNA